MLKHRAPTHSHLHLERHANTSSDYLKALVFGGLDGIVTIFAIVAGCVGAKLTSTQTVIVAIGNLLAGAVSMGFGEYVSASTEEDFLESERQREIWEVENFPEGEKQEMMEIYEHKYNFTKEDAQAMVNISFKYKDFCISHMMAEELGLLIGMDGPSPAQRGCVMFLAFTLFGLIPLGGFGVWTSYMDSHDHEDHHLSAFWVASVLSSLTLFILGAIKASFINRNSFKAGFQMLLNGIFAGSVAFGVGMFLQEIVGQNPLGG